jgi:hypothetical protein
MRSLLLATQVHKAAVRGSELAEDLNKFAKNAYANWQAICETTIDDGNTFSNDSTMSSDL